MSDRLKGIDECDGIIATDRKYQVLTYAELRYHQVFSACLARPCVGGVGLQWLHVLHGRIPNIDDDEALALHLGKKGKSLQAHSGNVRTYNITEITNTHALRLISETGKRDRRSPL